MLEIGNELLPEGWKGAGKEKGREVCVCEGGRGLVGRERPSSQANELLQTC